MNEIIEKEFAELRKTTIRFIEDAITIYGEPCFVFYYDFYLKYECLTGLDGIRVRVENGRVILGEGQYQSDITDNLRDLSVVATALAEGNVSDAPKR